MLSAFVLLSGICKHCVPAAKRKRGVYEEKGKKTFSLSGENRKMEEVIVGTKTLGKVMILHRA